MSTNNAEFISQICARRVDFQKPVEVYKIVELFGQNVLSSEGSVWRAHRKATAPVFSEELHGLVWTETLQQMDKLLVVWQARGSNSPDSMELSDFGRDTTALTLHVISKAGFGVPLSWPGQKPDAQQSTESLNLSGEEAPEGHDLPFKLALERTLTHLLWFAVFSPRVLGTFHDATATDLA